MKPSQAVKPISYFKAHASEVIRELGKTQGTVIITQNGSAKAVLQDVHAYEELQDSLALLRILAQGKDQASRGKLRPVDEAFGRVRARVKSGAGR